jgi:putative tricarboxylic transport membrane protein
MSDAGQHTSVRKLIRNPQDFYGGLVLAAFAVFMLWAGSDLPGMRGFAFGPGTAPRLFGVLLLCTGLAIAVMGCFTDGPPLEKYGVRGPVLFLTSVIFFAAAIRPVGLVITAFVTITVAAAATKEVRWVESLIWAAILTVFSVLLFVYGLKLPLQLWPRF